MRRSTASVPDYVPSPHRREGHGEGGAYEQAGSAPDPIRRAPSLLFALLLAGAFLGTLAACTPPVGVTDLDVVSGFRVSPTFNAFTEPCEIRYTLDEPAHVHIRITRADPDGSSALVRTITPERRETAGPRTAAWRGVGLDGLFAPQGEYVVELYARLDGSDRTVAWSLTTIMYRS